MNESHHLHANVDALLLAAGDAPLFNGAHNGRRQPRQLQRANLHARTARRVTTTTKIKVPHRNK
eukprot:1194298-Prorocentrum_minimum.AAC.5